VKVPAFIFRYRLHHPILWLLVAATWFYLRHDAYTTTSRLLAVTLVQTLIPALMVYTAGYWLLPRFLYTKKYFVFIAAYIVLLLAGSWFKLWLMGSITHNAALLYWWNDVRGRINDSLLPDAFLVTAAVSLKLLVDYLRAQQRLAALAREKAEAELNFLKSQINPHFLFNSLNAVYFLIDRENVEARRALHTFSEMLRYQLYEIGDEKIPIEKEIGFLRDYISLQSLRSDRCTVEMDVAPDLQNFFIEPLLLIPFVENSFKHLSHFSEAPNQVRIGMWKKSGSLVVRVGNTTEGGARNGAPGGIGLDNVRRRLQLLYPHRHELTVGEGEGWYNVHLQIKIDG